MASLHIPRSASKVDPDTKSQETRSLSGWRDRDAYVLLGDPGSGKTHAMEEECKAVGGLFLKAHDVVHGIAPTSISGLTVFIDGLDEVRAGTSDGRTPFNAIRKWLFDQGGPRFRLSCREADWRGASDLEKLKQVAPSNEVTKLHLVPLSDADAQVLLKARSGEIGDLNVFMTSLKKAGLSELLRSPLLLDLMVKAGQIGTGLTTRSSIYERACEQLAREENEEHLEAKPPKAQQTRALLHDAGLLCAILLLSGQRGVATAPKAASADTFSPFDLALPWRDLDAALGSKVFTMTNRVAEPRHRSIAEYLGGRALAQCIQEGLPLKRVLALMQGRDGMPVDPLRGLWAWLAVYLPQARDHLVSLDPLGFVLNGDVAALGLDERIGVLNALEKLAEKDAGFLQGVWVSHPFGPLARSDMAPVYEQILRDPRRDPGHLSFMECVFTALQNGQTMPSLASALQAWIEDAKLASHLRVDAYLAWKNSVGFSANIAMQWLQAIQSGKLQDNDDELCGVLLRDLYPEHVQPSEVFAYWHEPKQKFTYGRYSTFWHHWLWTQTQPQEFAALCDGWLQIKPASNATGLFAHEVSAIASKLLAHSLNTAGDKVSDARLYDWLGIGLDEYGSSSLTPDERDIVRQWLSALPDRMKALVAIGLARAVADKHGRWNFWQAQQRLHGAHLPRDWLFWLLDQARIASNPELARFCFIQAAHAALEPREDFDNPTLEQVKAWLVQFGAKWPDSSQWLEETRQSRAYYKAEQSSREKRYQLQQAAEEEKRKQALAPHLPSVLSGTAPPGLLHDLARSYSGGFSNIKGETPLERVGHYLVTDRTTAQAAIEAIPLVLQRPDLPTVEEALALAAKGRQHYIRPAALLAAKLVHEQGNNAPLNWPQDLTQRLVAYYLTDGTGDMPAWYHLLAEHRAEWVAPVLENYALRQFKTQSKGQSSPYVTGLWSLGGEARHVQLTRLALPDLLQAVPLRANPGMRSMLNRSLLSALPALDRDVAAQLIQKKLRQAGMDALQRIAWLVADLPFRADAAVELSALVGDNERRAVALGEALHEQGVFKHAALQLAPSALEHLVAVLVPITPADRTLGGGWVTNAEHRGDTVRGLLAALSSNPSQEAKAVLQRLAQTPSLSAWSEAIQFSLRSHAATAREANFQVPNAKTVACTLANQVPANPADLRALVMDHLAQMQDQWRGRDTFALKLFWQDSIRKPKEENFCRDLLLEKLRAHLKPLNILVGRECSAARDKRIDMCAEFTQANRRIVLPIEVKEDHHDKLWTAWRDQLKHLYTIDPDAQGFGLYLVLWFGTATRLPPEGLKPRKRLQNAEQLLQALQERIPPADRHRLAVQVLDLSWPE
ncbi:MAG: hypothetical protein RIS44_2555 [Pseudomonadota bacterium]|jgi:hypothetical protein